MSRPMPYLPSARWYALWLVARAGGHDDAGAVKAANAGASVSGKDFARCRIAVRGRATLLSVAVEGGADRLRNPRALWEAAVSMHGNWPHVHLGALEAVYGRTPYYRHIMPALRDVLQEPPARLMELNTRLHGAVAPFLTVPAGAMTAVQAERAREVASLINPELSIIDPLMRLGTETSLGLLALI